jgi:hypothetical protein
MCINNDVINIGKMGILRTSTSTDDEDSRDFYLFGNKTSFSDLGVLPCLRDALVRLDKPIATSIQATGE